MAVSFRDISLLAAGLNTKDINKNAFSAIDEDFKSANMTTPTSAFSNAGQIASVATAFAEGDDPRLQETGKRIQQRVRDLVEK